MRYVFALAICLLMTMLVWGGIDLTGWKPTLYQSIIIGAICGLAFTNFGFGLWDWYFNSK